MNTKSWQDREFNNLSIFGGKEQWRFDEGKKVAMSGVKEVPHGRSYSDKFMEGFEAGKAEYKTKKMHAILSGTWKGETLSEEELDKLFERNSKVSPGGIHLR